MAVRYLHVADDLRRRIATGAIPAGGQLPSEEELASCYRVGRPTLRRALEVLQDEGLVEKFHGRGNFVRQPFQRLTYVGGSRAWAEQVADAALSVTVDVNDVEAQGCLSSLLQVPAGTPLAEYVYLSEQEGKPRIWARVYVPRGLGIAAPTGNGSPWGDDIREQLVAAGLQLVATAECIIARFPTAEEMEILRITGRTSVLAIERTSTDVSGRVVEAALLVLPGDRAEVRLTIHALDVTEAER